MKLLVLPRYGRLGASSRMRQMQYFARLKAAGFELTVSVLFDDEYVAGLQRASVRLGDVVRAYAQRLSVLFDSRSFDLVWIEKDALPWLPAWFEQALILSRVPYVLDYDDAVFHHYNLHGNPLVKFMLGGKHEAMMRGAALVVAGNPYLADFARKAGARRIEIIPTVIDLDRYPLALQMRSSQPEVLPCIGWIGQRSTAHFLAPYKQLFERLASTGQAHFSAIGIDALSLGLPMESIRWTEQSEVASISSFDIGIMPLVDEPFERGKCGYKLFQYMACGLPVVASPVGVNRQIVESGVNGFLAETPEQWEQALLTLLGDAELRWRMGQAGRRKVEQQYCLQVTWPRLDEMLRSTMLAY